jgi:hypothetical protein
VDYGSAEILLCDIVDHITLLRDEQHFKMIYEDSVALCSRNNITVENDVHVRVERIRKIPTRFRDFFVDSTICNRKKDTSEASYRINLYYPLIDALLLEIRDRFAPATSTILRNLSVLHPQNNHFLDGNKIKNLAVELNLDSTCTVNENNVLLHMFTSDRKPEDIIDLFHQIRPLKHAFPNMFNLVTIAITMPVSSTTCERTFSRLKLIKTFARNKMGDGRLSDMAILAIEREIMIDLDRTVEQFSKKHINSRILLL